MVDLESLIKKHYKCASVGLTTSTFCKCADLITLDTIEKFMVHCNVRQTGKSSIIDEFIKTNLNELKKLKREVKRHPFIYDDLPQVFGNTVLKPNILTDNILFPYNSIKLDIQEDEE